MISSMHGVHENLTTVHMLSEPEVTVPHVALVHDRFPGNYETTDVYVNNLMEIMRSWKWKVTLVTLLQGAKAQMDNYHKVKDLGVQVIIISSATATTSRGEMEAALSTLPKVDLFFLIQTHMSREAVAPMAILRPFLHESNAVVFSSDTYSRRSRDLNLAKIALDTNGPIQDFAPERATWIPKAATTQRLDVNEVLEQFSIEKKSISFADRMYFTSTEDIENFGDIICESRPACEREKHLMHMRVFDVGNPQKVVNSVPPFTQRKKILFLGGESEVDTLNLRFFMERILPKIVADLPNIQAVVFSASCMESPNVVCGDVGKNLNEALDSALLLAYPAIAGTGVHLKNWLALSRGVPVVTTTYGGISFPETDSGVIVGNDAESLARACLKLAKDENHWKTISSKAIEYAREKASMDASLSLLDLFQMTVFKRPYYRQSVIEEADMVTFENGRPTIKAEQFTFVNSLEMVDSDREDEMLASEVNVRRTKCDTAPQWQQHKKDYKFLFLYWRSPSQYVHYDQDVFQLVEVLARMLYPVTVLTLMPTATSSITNELSLKALSVHFVHLNDAGNPDKIEQELLILQECLQFNVIITVPEYSVGIRQKYYLEVMKVLEELEDFASIPRVLLMPTLFRLTYPYSRELASRTVHGRGRGGFFPTVNTEFNELVEIDRDFDELLLFREDLGRLYWYERDDAKRSHMVLFTADQYLEKARSIWCGALYKFEAQQRDGEDPSEECFLDKTGFTTKVASIGALPFETPLKATGRNRLVFVGTESARNVEGVIWYMQSVLPKVKEQLENVKIGFYGPICNYLQEGNTWEYFKLSDADCMDSVNETVFISIMRETRVYLNPMVSGIDSNGRLISPMRAGVPVVSTTLGAKEFGKGPHIAIADTAQGFVDRIKKLFKDDQVWEATSAATIKWLNENRSEVEKRRFITETMLPMLKPFKEVYDQEQADKLEALLFPGIAKSKAREAREKLRAENRAKAEARREARAQAKAEAQKRAEARREAREIKRQAAKLRAEKRAGAAAAAAIDVSSGG
eukprot:CAMPEP_0184745990 /NCGR_PEP_ID=MMETSP0315-20130426/8592_1 /TAXON_ID=101924 /ORGANISM="Rhodosorus marinus, Strain UTEX LB 2760" /LENGTH=1035 /DNA_ID=CAMNT_0027218371 /DNA_START=462 /DNA_END=3569 /DNA_ORIENTATION=+